MIAGVGKIVCTAAATLRRIWGENKSAQNSFEAGGGVADKQACTHVDLGGEGWKMDNVLLLAPLRAPAPLAHVPAESSPFIYTNGQQHSSIQTRQSCSV